MFIIRNVHEPLWLDDLYQEVACSCVCTSHVITINIYFLSAVDRQK